MNGEAIISVSAAVVALVQLLKWSFLEDKYGPLAVLALALFGVVFWGYSEGTFERTNAFEYFAGWIAVATSAAGVFGFSRASASAMVKVTPPPNDGAGSSRTTT